MFLYQSLTDTSLASRAIIATVLQDESSPPDVTDTVGHLDLSIRGSLIESKAKYKSQVA